MGQRLNIEITCEKQVLASGYYNCSAHSEEALQLVEQIAETYAVRFSHKKDIFTAVHLLESTGAGISGIERNRIQRDETGRFNDIPFCPAKNRNCGLIAVTEDGIANNRRWENARIIIDLEKETFFFGVYFYTYEEEFEDKIDLPYFDADVDIFMNIPLNCTAALRRLMETCPDGFRMKTGDVVEWIL